jgi:hypothetical protein
LIECRGISFKEISCIGAGGRLLWNVNTSGINFGKISCNVNYIATIEISNMGDIVLNPVFSSKNVTGKTDVEYPSNISIRPGGKAKVTISVEIRESGDFETELSMNVQDQIKTVLLKGAGTMIQLSSSGLRVLRNEQLSILSLIDPLNILIETDQLRIKQRTMTKEYELDMQIVNGLGTKIKRIPAEGKIYKNIRDQNISKAMILKEASEADTDSKVMLALSKVCKEYY